MLRKIVLGSLLTGGLLPGNQAQAVEGAMGRPISGATIMPYAGVVPPGPGFAIGVGETYYAGDLRGSTTVPVGRNLTLGIDLKASFTPISLTCVWDTGKDSWDFASAVSIPFAWMEAEAELTLGTRSGRVRDTASGLFDLAFVPVVASHHFSETGHVAFGLTVWAPTGEYDPDALANLGMNKWSFIPGVACTKLFPAADVELSASWGLTFDLENDETDYQNGILSDLEVIAVKRFKPGAGIGLVGSWIGQITDDRGATADRLDGFRGRAFGIGPLLTYSTKLGTHSMELNARFVHEFGNRNYVEGNMFMLNADIQF